MSGNLWRCTGYQGIVAAVPARNRPAWLPAVRFFEDFGSGCRAIADELA